MVLLRTLDARRSISNGFGGFGGLGGSGEYALGLDRK
jgi:hypothetical protein